MSQNLGPLLSDQEFFKECLNYDFPGMEEVKRAADNNDYPAARKHFANNIRLSLRPDFFFKIPFEILERTHTYPNETEKEAADRIVKHRLISCGVAHDFGEVVDWCANPTYNQYREWTWQLNRHNDWKALAYVYRETGDEKYAKACAELFDSWVKQAIRPDEDADGFETHCWRTIECGIRMGCNWPYVLHAFYQSAAFTDDIITDWYKSIVEHGRRLSRKYKKGNWLIIEMNGLAHIGILCPQLKDSEMWLSFAFNKLKEELDKQIYPDGFQYELATGYHDGVLSNYQRLFLTSKAYGVEFPPEFITVLERMALIDVKLMQPDGKLPNLNDGSRLKVSTVLASRLEMFPHNQEILWAATEGARGKLPEYTSVALPYSGFTIMRTGWTSDDSWVFFDGGPFGRAHQHEDKLSLLYFTGGKLILTEAGNYAYDDSEMREYVLSTRGHNTIRVNGMDQNRRTGYTFEENEINEKADIVYYFSSDYDYAEASYTEGYGPLQEKLAKHNRSIYFIKKPLHDLKPFLIVVDRLESDEEREYEAIWHFDTESAVIVQGTDNRTGTVVMEELTVFISPDKMNLSIVKGQPEPELQGYIANSAIQGDYRAVPTLLAKKKASNIRLVTVLVPNQNGNCAVHGIKASSCIEDTKIILNLTDGTAWEIDEKSMKDG